MIESSHTTRPESERQRRESAPACAAHRRAGEQEATWSCVKSYSCHGWDLRLKYGTGVLGGLAASSRRAHLASSGCPDAVAQALQGDGSASAPDYTAWKAQGALDVRSITHGWSRSRSVREGERRAFPGFRLIREFLSLKQRRMRGAHGGGSAHERRSCMHVEVDARVFTRRAPPCRTPPSDLTATRRPRPRAPPSAWCSLRRVWPPPNRTQARGP
jgi:hypothetical protein